LGLVVLLIEVAFSGTQPVVALSVKAGMGGSSIQMVRDKVSPPQAFPATMDIV
jgi:hypothetical protein